METRRSGCDHASKQCRHGRGHWERKDRGMEEHRQTLSLGDVQVLGTIMIRSLVTAEGGRKARKGCEKCC